jgi:hypothetical protein
VRIVSDADATLEVDMDTTLARWIEERRVCYEISALREMDHGGAVQVGYELTLFADAGHDDPGSAALYAVYERLKQVVTAVLPQDVRPTSYVVDPSDGSWHLRPQTRWHPEVELRVRIVHREGYLRPSDACESRCVHEIQDALRRAGLREKSWPALPPGGDRTVAAAT